MADLLKARPLAELGGGGIAFGDPMAAGIKIFEGALVGLDAAGNAVKAAPAVAKMRGVAKATVDNTSGVAGSSLVETRKGTFRFNHTGLDRTHLESDVYIVDDNTVGAAGTLIAGKLVQIDLAGAWVEIR